MIKKPNILILLVFMASLMITSCIEEYDLEDKDFESKLVINSIFDNDSPWSVQVSTSSDAHNSDSESEKVTFASVKIYDQKDKYIDDLYHQGEGIYANEDFGPSPKRSYSIKVSAPGYRAVTATSFVPEKSTLVINNFSIIPNDKRNDVEVDFEIEDKSMLESYYVWEVVSLEDDSGGSMNKADSQLSDTWINELTNPVELANSDREILEGGSFGDGTYQGTYSSFEGNRIIGFVPNIKDNKNNKNNLNSNLISSASLSEVETIMADMDPSIGNPNEVETYVDPKEGNPNIGEDDESKIIFKYELRVMSISKELYKYHTSLREGQILNDGYTSSNQYSPSIYTNVSNGLGIFAGFSETVLQF